MDDKMHHLLKLPEHVTFFNKGYLINYFKTIESNSKIIIDGSINKTMDYDAKEVITEFIETAKEKQIEIKLINFNL